MWFNLNYLFHPNQLLYFFENNNFDRISYLYMFKTDKLFLISRYSSKILFCIEFIGKKTFLCLITLICTHSKIIKCSIFQFFICDNHAKLYINWHNNKMLSLSSVTQRYRLLVCQPQINIKWIPIKVTFFLALRCMPYIKGQPGSRLSSS